MKKPVVVFSLIFCGLLAACGDNEQGGGGASSAVQGIAMPVQVSAVTAN